MAKATTAQRFWRKVRKDAASGCWEWQGCRDSDGYGRFRIPPGEDGGPAKTVGAHRWSYHAATGESPPLVRHACDNPRCVNPDHLRGGTDADNARDKVCRGRSMAGEANAGAKLTRDEVRTMRIMARAGAPDKMLAKYFRVARAQCRAIREGRAWRR